MADSKQGERDYYSRVGLEEMQRAMGKPFTDQRCDQDLGNIAALFQLLGPPPSRVIELGCGVGWLAIMLARRGFDTVGVDISSDAIAAGRAQAESEGLANLTLQEGDYENLAGEDDSFDAAIFFSSLHHAENEAAAMAGAYRILRPGGLLIAFEPGKGHHRTAPSRQAMKQYGVHEKDMPIGKIIALGQTAGFRRHLRLPEPWDFLRTVYRPSYGRARSSRDAFGKFILGVLRSFQRFFFQRMDQSFVVLWK